MCLGLTFWAAKLCYSQWKKKWSQAPSLWPKKTRSLEGSWNSTEFYTAFLRWPRAPLGLLAPFAIPDGLAGLGQDLVRQFCLANPAELCLSVSEDGGRTWRPPVCLGQIAIPYHVEEKVVSFISGGLEAPLLPNAGVDPFFYLAWVDFRNIITTPDYPEGRPDFDVYFRKVPIQWGAGSH